VKQWLMAGLLCAAAWGVIPPLELMGQQASFQDALLDQLVGAWAMDGTILGKHVVHQVAVDWMLGHEYLRIHEVSREKNPQGQPDYEAWVFIGWDQHSGQYDCLWLDTTSGEGLVNPLIGHARRGGDEIPFLFKASDGSVFHNTFTYDRSNQTWQWTLDSEQDGKLKPFARLRLKRQG